MYSALELITTVLISQEAITNEIPAANIYPVVAEADVDGDFLVFTVRREQQASKDRAMEYVAEIDIYSTNIKSAVQKGDIIEQAIISYPDKRIKSRGASVEYTEQLERGVIKLIFTFKL